LVRELDQAGKESIFCQELTAFELNVGAKVALGRQNLNLVRSKAKSVMGRFGCADDCTIEELLGIVGQFGQTYVTAFK
jgi:hypothetical protein